MSDDLYSGHCEAGCLHFHGGEVRHHKDCGHYPQSLTKFFEDRIRELEAEVERLRAGQSVTVKTLEWHGLGRASTAYSIFGSYDISGFDGKWSWAFEDEDMHLEGRSAASEEAAKAAAQADYEARILSALTPAPVTVSEAARERVARLFWEFSLEVLRDYDVDPEIFKNDPDASDACGVWADAALSALAGQGGEV